MACHVVVGGIVDDDDDSATCSSSVEVCSGDSSLDIMVVVRNSGF